MTYWYSMFFLDTSKSLCLHALLPSSGCWHLQSISLQLEYMLVRACKRLCAYVCVSILSVSICVFERIRVFVLEWLCMCVCVLTVFVEIYVNVMFLYTWISSCVCVYEHFHISYTELYVYSALVDSTAFFFFLDSSQLPSWPCSSSDKFSWPVGSWRS